MRRITIRPDFGSREMITIGFSACWHVGNNSCQEASIVAMLRGFRRKQMPWYHLGDAIEAIAPHDKRYCCETHRQTIAAQCARSAELVRYGVDTMVGMHIGNHEDKLSRLMGDLTMDILTRACKDDRSSAKRLWLGGIAFTNVVCPAGSCVVLTAHGDKAFGGLTSDPNQDAERMRTALRRYLSRFDAQLKVVAHAHTEVIAPPVTTRSIGFSGYDKRAVSVEWCAACPSMFKTYNDGDSMDYPEYAERAMYGPAGIGWIEADIMRDGTVSCVRGVRA